VKLRRVVLSLESCLHAQAGNEGSFASSARRFDHLDIRRDIEPVGRRDVVKDLQPDLAAVEDEATQVAAEAGVITAEAESVMIPSRQHALTADAKAVELLDGVGIAVGKANSTEDAEAL
jgi:hypothetical protein